MSGERGPGGNGQGVLVGAIAVAVLVVAAAVWAPVAVTGPPGYTGQGLFDTAFAVAAGEISWTLACTIAAVIEAVVLAVLAIGLRWAWTHRKHRGSRVDAKARHMAGRSELDHLSPQGVQASARRLRPSLAEVKVVEPDEAGVLIAHQLRTGMPLRQSWEDMAVDIWGPRTGKTTARAIPAIVASPGPVLVTSVKGDIVDATRGPRETRGTIAVFDPQQIWGSQPQRLWWNPLAAITTITEARRLAEHFAAAEREPGVSRDAFFDPKSEDLTANLLLAAAVGHRSILDVYKWATNPRDDTAVRLLRDNGHELPAYAVEGVINLPDKTRGGIYGGAERSLSCLTEPAVSAWVTAPTDPGVDEFSPADFVAGTGTLYLLSQGGPGSPAPLIAALTDAVLRAGEAQARASRGRRLDPPLLSVLDEAANICRMRQLPALYSFYGSMGLPIITILQSYAQGVDVWGREGMRKLWSAANVRTYGGGVADPDFLEELSKLIGEHDVTVRSTSHRAGGWTADSVSRSTRRERILDIAALHALPRGRMVVYSSGARPVLARTAPWQTGPYADQIRTSIARFDPDQQTDWNLATDPGADADPTGTPP
ncbi:type IV secretory system conjugative DNA transfer family protein [Actinoplanes subglobosus]|uniref:Type IV secretory system conjugative DNA transfer family protein n=1 Tax=Actinoplanes subglobosus TaxID=1547892 RepID=A0ABV8IR57_9ACTN